MLTGDFKDVRLKAIEAEPPLVYAVSEADLLRVPDCTICGGEPQVLTQVYVGELEVFTTVVCQGCSYVWRSITPGAAWFKHSEHKLHRCQGMTAQLGVEDQRYAAYKRRLEYLAHYVKGGIAVLDVGAALGSGVEALLDDGFEVTALEADAHRAALLREYRISVIEGTVEDALRGGRLEEYRLMMACHVIEHCRDPLYVLAGLAKQLATGGVIYVEVPSWQIINWSDAFYLAHMSNFSTASFWRLANQVGLAVVDAIQFVHEDSRIDLGFVLAAGPGKEPQLAQLPFVVTLRLLYRKGMTGFPADGVLRYRVPHFDHYNYGLRFNRYDSHYARDGVIKLAEG